AVDVDRVDARPLFHLGAHLFGPRLGAEDADLQARRPRIQALLRELVDDRQHVRRRHHDQPGPEVVDELYLTRRHAAGDRDDGAAEPLGTGVRAEAAGEQAVAVGVVQAVARPAAGRADGP